MSNAAKNIIENKQRDSFVRLLVDLKERNHPNFEDARKEFERKYGFDYKWLLEWKEEKAR